MKPFKVTVVIEGEGYKKKLTGEIQLKKPPRAGSVLASIQKVVELLRGQDLKVLPEETT